MCRVAKSGCQVYLPDYGLVAYANESQLPASWRFDHTKNAWTNIKDGDRLYITQTRQFRVDSADPIRGELLLKPSPLAPRNEQDAKGRGKSRRR